MGKTIGYLFIGALFLMLCSCNNVEQGKVKEAVVSPKTEEQALIREETKKYSGVNDTVRLKNYFHFMDSLVIVYDSLTPYSLSEHLLVRANPWIMDTLVSTDYYHMMERDSFVYDQTQLIVLRPSDSILIPDSLFAKQLSDKILNTRIDINIPEFKLRIYEGNTLLHTFPIRVGQNRKRYLKMCGQVVDLRTKIGQGQILEHRRNPVYYNPVDGKRFYTTLRDDKRRTLMPQIPWIVTEINGIHNGQLIHPTTNPISLGKAYSNGCIGTGEADAWVIYYHAPIGTKITIRYDLNVVDAQDKKVLLEDIYGLF